MSKLETGQTYVGRYLTGRQARLETAHRRAMEITELNNIRAVFPGAPSPVEKNDPLELRERLREVLTCSGWSKPKIDDLITFVDEIQAKHESRPPKKPGKTPGRRDNGVPSTNHELEIMIIQAFLNRVGLDDMKLAAAHDLEEDLPEYWQLLKRQGRLSSRTIGRVHGVSSVKGRKLSRLTPEQQKDENARATTSQLIGLAKRNPRALDLKLNGDIWNNAFTFDAMESQGNALIKAQRVLNVFDRIHCLFGNRGIADQNADNAFKVVNSKEFRRICQLQTNAYAPFNGEETNILHQALSGIVDIWGNAITGYSQDRLIGPITTSVEQRSIYRAYQRMGKEVEERDTLPFIKITCVADAQKVQWIGFLKKHAKAYEEKRGKNTILCFKPSSNGKQLPPIEIVITTEEEEITPDILFMTHARLTDRQRLIAEKKLDDIVRVYEKAQEDRHDVTVNVPEMLYETIGFLTDSDELLQTPKGSTYLDAITMIHPGLANETVLILAFGDDGNLSPVMPGESLIEGTKIKAVKEKDLSNYPDGFRQYCIGFSPARYDMVTTRTSVRAISRELENREFTAEMLKTTRLRARRIIAERYQAAEILYRRFDQFAKDGFDDFLETKYGTVSNMLEQIGRIPIPHRDDKTTKAEWDEPDTYILTPPQLAILSDMRKLVENLLKYRSKLPTMKIRLNNKSGVLRNLGIILEEADADILPMRAFADNLSDHPDDEYPVIIELVFRDVNGTKADQIEKQIQEIYKCDITRKNFPAVN